MQDKLKAAKEALLIYKEYLLSKDNITYENKMPTRMLLFWIDEILSKDSRHWHSHSR